jgi:hypothetical protein
MQASEPCARPSASCNEACCFDSTLSVTSDAEESSHTIAAITTATGQVLGDKTVKVGARGFATLLIWARGLDGERVWALEDCRHVSGALERFLIARGERVVGVSTRLMAATRRSSRGGRTSATQRSSGREAGMTSSSGLDADETAEPASERR